jgi:ribosomal protein S12 methylthiotransferase accessory factor
MVLNETSYLPNTKSKVLNQARSADDLSGRSSLPDPYARAAAAAKASGVTRLGEITHLDRVGVPVFQAVRPWGRALSVHQGKGLTGLDAQIGALMEAVESANAEAFAGQAFSAAWADLAAEERAPCLADFAATRARPPPDDEPLPWVPALRILDGGRLWVPFNAVSLDFARPGDARLSRSSNGQAAHFDLEQATIAALLEVIERDAVAAWFGMSRDQRLKTLIDPRSIPYAWFADLQGRLLAADLRLSLYCLMPVVPYPVFLAEIRDPAREWPAIYGTGCDRSPEEALKKSVLEAVQSRLTEISGARDDILYRSAGNGPGMGLASPPPFHMSFADWDTIAAEAIGPPSPTSAAIADELRSAGYPQAAVVDLSGLGSDVFVVKAFVPGLGALKRARRPPLRGH